MEDRISRIEKRLESIENTQRRILNICIGIVIGLIIGAVLFGVISVREAVELAK